MKQFSFYIFGVSLLSSVFALALIRECPTIQEVLPEALPDTLVILDIDNTLIRPCQSLGSNEWFQHQLKQKKEAFQDPEEALNQTIDLLHSIYAVTKVQTMEPETAKVIRQLQDRNVMVMGATYRGPMIASLTIRQLASVGIDLSVTSPSKATFPLIDLSESLYYRGILFSSGKSKRQALLGFFRQLSWRPKRIVCIDDQKKYLEEISAFEDEGIPFVGLRFSGGDVYIKDFNPQLCEIELKAFNQLLSDDEARELLQ
jgi:hypothetical protein